MVNSIHTYAVDGAGSLTIADVKSKYKGIEPGVPNVP